MRRKKINRNGWYFKTLEKPIAFSFLTPGLPTEWTHFLLWFQLLPVIIQVSNLLTLAPGAYSHLLTKHLKLDAPSASNSKCPGLNYHFTSNLLPSPCYWSHQMELQSPSDPKQRASSQPLPLITKSYGLDILFLLFISTSIALILAFLMLCPNLFSQLVI